MSPGAPFSRFATSYKESSHIGGSAAEYSRLVPCDAGGCFFYTFGEGWCPHHKQAACRGYTAKVDAFAVVSFCINEQLSPDDENW